MKLGEKVVPKLILNKNGHFWFYSLDKSFGVPFCIERKVKNVVGSAIIFPHFIARWRKKGKHNF